MGRQRRLSPALEAWHRLPRWREPVVAEELLSCEDQVNGYESECLIAFIINLSAGHELELICPQKVRPLQLARGIRFPGTSIAALLFLETIHKRSLRAARRLTEHQTSIDCYRHGRLDKEICLGGQIVLVFRLLGWIPTE